MPKPSQCKGIGAFSSLLGLAVLIISALFLSLAIEYKCYKDKAPSTGFEYSNEETGGSHGGYYGYGKGGLESRNYNKDKEEYKQSPQSDEKEKFYNLESKVKTFVHNYKNGVYCLPKFITGTGLGIAGGILQIILSLVYCCANKKNVKCLSLIWCIGHFLIPILYIAGISLVLTVETEHSESTTEKSGTQYTFEDFKKYLSNPKSIGLYQTKDYKYAFCSILGINCVLLFLLKIFVVATWKRSDYDDYLVDQEQTTVHVSRKKLES